MKILPFAKRFLGILLLGDVFCDSFFFFKRSLPNLAKQYVLRLLFLEEGLPLSQVSAWNQTKDEKKHQLAVDRLIKLKLCKIITRGSVKMESAERILCMNSIFQKQLRLALQET